MNDRSLWEEQAGWWQQGFTDGADPEYEEQILPLIDRHLAGSRRILDIGCGEGQASRRLTALGSEVIGLDPTRAQLRTASDRGGGPAYAHAIAEALPCRGGSFDAVVMCLVIEHIEAYDVAIREVARVLEPGGKFLLLLNHPLLQAPGQWLDRRPHPGRAVLESRAVPQRRHRHRGSRPRGQLALHAPPPQSIHTRDG